MTPGDAPTTEELREALIAAVEEARKGSTEKPPVDPPPRLKQLLTFRKFTERALGQVRAVVEQDEEFRERVAAAVDQETMGRIGWLWLTRPDGWEQECAELAAASEQELEVDADAQGIQDLEQSLQKAEDARTKVEGQRDKAVRERDEARLKARQARSEARQFEEKSRKLESDLAQVRTDRDTIQNSLERIQRKESRTDERLKKAQKQIERLNRQMRDVSEEHEDEVANLKERLAVAEHEVATAREAGFELPTEPEPPEEPEPLPRPLTRRLPVSVPAGMLNDTAEAAEYLFRSVPEIVVLIDGYNVTFKNWEAMPVHDQRIRFLQKLEELSSRYSGAQFVVVFDGSETDYDYVPTTARSLGVSVQFSSPGVTADDHIIDLCASYPLRRPLVVVSEDNEVREGARKQGANLIHPRKLLGIMGLEVEDPEGWTSFGAR